MVYVTRREKISAAHRLFRSDWSDEKNFEIFGACSNPNWHGHNYQLFVTVKGNINAETGFVVNLKELSKIIRHHILRKLDHRNINLEVEFMENKIASTENLAKAVWDELLNPISQLGIELHCIKIVETENNYIEYFGD